MPINGLMSSTAFTMTLLPVPTYPNNQNQIGLNLSQQIITGSMSAQALQGQSLVASGSSYSIGTAIELGSYASMLSSPQTLTRAWTEMHVPSPERAAALFRAAFGCDPLTIRQETDLLGGIGIVMTADHYHGRIYVPSDALTGSTNSYAPNTSVWQHLRAQKDVAKEDPVLDPTVATKRRFEF